MSFANLYYLPENLLCHDQFRSDFRYKCGLRERRAIFATRRSVYPAVTSKNESNVKLFPPFLQPPAFNPAKALTLRQIVLEARQNFSNNGRKKHEKSDPNTGQYYPTHMFCIINTNETLAKLAGLAELIEYRVKLLWNEQKAIADNQLEFLRVAKSFQQDKHKGQMRLARQRRLILVLMAASGAAWLMLGNPIIYAACSALPLPLNCAAIKKTEKRHFKFHSPTEFFCWNNENG